VPYAEYEGTITKDDIQIVVIAIAVIATGRPNCLPIIHCHDERPGVLITRHEYRTDSCHALSKSKVKYL